MIERAGRSERAGRLRTIDRAAVSLESGVAHETITGEGLTMLPLEDQARPRRGGRPRQGTGRAASCYSSRHGHDRQRRAGKPSHPGRDGPRRHRPGQVLGSSASTQRACKLFRAVIILGERGFVGEVTVLTRSLFETTLALNFVMSETVTLKRDGKNFDPDPARPLTTDFRGLYGSRSAFADEKRFGHGTDGRNSGGNREARRPEGDRGRGGGGEGGGGGGMVAGTEAWYAGLSVKDLADSLGSFPTTSCSTATSRRWRTRAAFSHFDVSDDGSHGLLDLTPSPDGIGRRSEWPASSS